MIKEEAKEILNTLEATLISKAVRDAKKPLIQSLRMDVGRCVCIEGVPQLVYFIERTLEPAIKPILANIETKILPALAAAYKAKEILLEDYLVFLRRFNQMGNRMGYLARLIDDAQKLSKCNVQVHLRESGYDMDTPPQHGGDAKLVHRLIGGPGDHLARQAALIHNRLKSKRQNPISWKGEKKGLSKADVHPNGPKQHSDLGSRFFVGTWKKKQYTGSDTAIVETHSSLKKP